MRRKKLVVIQEKQKIDSYTIQATGEVIRVGDCVLLESGNDELPFVARIENIMIPHRKIKVRVRWYYRPEDTTFGHPPFIGSKELFLSEMMDDVFADTILKKCVIHRLKDYCKLEVATDDDYFSRFEYDAKNGVVVPESIPLYCICCMPFNPDQKYVHCEKCKDRLHPSCIGKLDQDVQTNEKFICDGCKDEKVDDVLE